MSEMIGRAIGAYQVIEQLGQGGMATVYKAYQASMDRYVAIKVLPRHFAQDPTFVGRFEQEAKVIAKLEHARILPVYDYGQQDGITYIVMRYLQAGTLSDRLEAGPLALQEAARITGQIAEGLDYAHSLGVIHRDVKPANIMLDASNDVYITDFGISKLVEGTAQFTGSGIIGTPAYLAPEQGLGEGIDYRTDIYSLGVVLYQMLTGDLPFHAETPMGIVIKHINEPTPQPREVNPAIPEAVEAVVLRAMAKRPDERYASCYDLSAALWQAVSGGTPRRQSTRAAAGARIAPAAETMPVETMPSPLPGEGDAETAAAGDAATAPVEPSAATRQTPRWVMPVTIGGIVIGLGLLVVIVVLLLRGGFGPGAGGESADMIPTAAEPVEEAPIEEAPPAEMTPAEIVPVEGGVPGQGMCGPDREVIFFTDFEAENPPAELPDGAVIVEAPGGDHVLELNGGGEPLIYVFGPSMVASSMVMRVALPDGAGDLGLASRVTSPDEAYALILKPVDGTHQLDRGSETVIGPDPSQGLAPGQVHMITLNTGLDALEAFLDDQRLFVWKDENPLPEGRFAVEAKRGTVVVEQVAICSYAGDVAIGGPLEEREKIFADDFNGTLLHEKWEWIDESPNWEIVDGRLMIEITPGTGLALAAMADAPPLPALVTGVPELPTFQATVSVEAFPRQEGQAAGLIVMGEARRPLFTLTRSACRPGECEGSVIRFQGWTVLLNRIVDAEPAGIGTLPPDAPVILRLTLDGDRLAAAYKTRDGDWEFVGSAPVSELADERIGYIGLVTSAAGLDTEPEKAFFDDFLLTR